MTDEDKMLADYTQAIDHAKTRMHRAIQDGDASWAHAVALVKEGKLMGQEMTDQDTASRCLLTFVGAAAECEADFDDACLVAEALEEDCQALTGTVETVRLVVPEAANG